VGAKVLEMLGFDGSSSLVKKASKTFAARDLNI
jgi:hypothetical protein